MKKLLFLLLILPLLSSAQVEFGSMGTKQDQVYFPAIKSLAPIPNSNKLNFIKKNSRTFPTFRLSKENYRQPVSMSEYLASNDNYVESEIKTSLNAKNFGISTGNSSYSADGSTKVKNFVYKDASQGFLFSGACPPHGICPRCAPFRMGNSYY